MYNYSENISQYARTMDNYSTSADIGAYYALGAFFIAFMGFFLLVGLALTILQIVSMWKIFTKAGEEGWKAIIPIYNVVTLFKISGLSPWLLFVYFAGIIPFFGWLVILGLTIYQVNNLAKSFGKETGFAVGLFFIPSIFYLILGLGKSEYVGPGGNPVENDD